MKTINSANSSRQGQIGKKFSDRSMASQRSPRSGGPFDGKSSFATVLTDDSRASGSSASAWQESQSFGYPDLSASSGLPSLQPPLLCRDRATGPGDLPARYQVQQQAPLQGTFNVPLQALLAAFQTYTESLSPPLGLPGKPSPTPWGASRLGSTRSSAGWSFDGEFGGHTDSPSFGSHSMARQSRSHQVFTPEPSMSSGLTRQVGDSTGSTAIPLFNITMSDAGVDKSREEVNDVKLPRHERKLQIVDDLPDMLKKSPKPSPMGSARMKERSKARDKDKAKVRSKEVTATATQEEKRQKTVEPPSWLRNVTEKVRPQDRVLMTGKKHGVMDDPVINQLQQMEARLTMIAQAIREAHITEFDSSDNLSLVFSGPWMNGLDSKMGQHLSPDIDTRLSQRQSQRKHSVLQRLSHRESSHNDWKNPRQSKIMGETKKRVSAHTTPAHTVCFCCDKKLRDDEGLKDDFPGGDGEWYCFNCLEEIRSEMVVAASKIQAIHRGGIARKKVAKKKRVKAKATLCGDCGEMKTAGRIDPESNEWYCNECWANFAIPQNEEEGDVDEGEVLEEGDVDETKETRSRHQSKEQHKEASEAVAAPSVRSDKQAKHPEKENDPKASEKSPTGGAHGTTHHHSKEIQRKHLSVLHSGEVHKAADQTNKNALASQTNKDSLASQSNKDYLAGRKTFAETFNESKTGHQELLQKQPQMIPMSNTEEQICSQCGELKAGCTQDPDDGVWYCPACCEENGWEVDDEEGEESEEEEVPEGYTFCDGCHEVKKSNDGEKDSESDNWFCNACWSVAEG